MKSLNMCNIFMYKSKRKNTEISDIIKVLNTYNNDNDILYQLIGTLEYDNAIINSIINNYYKEVK